MRKNFFKEDKKIKYLYEKKVKNMIYIITFGSDRSFLKICKKVLISLKNLYPNAFYFNYQSKDLDINIVNYCEKYKRGYGYWIWKPYLILKTLRIMPIGSTLLYVDGRTGLHPNCKKIDWFDKFINSNRYDIGLFKTVHKEYKWTTGDLFSLFNLTTYSSSASTEQYCGTYLCFKNNIKTQKFVEAWLDILINKSHLCRDESSYKSNHKKFIQNRHDQSVLSLLTKYSKKYMNLKVFNIPHPLKVEKPTLIPHYYYRPTGFYNLIKRYIKLTLVFVGILDKKNIGKYYDGLRI